MIQWISGKVVENFQWSDSVFSLRVITESFDFKAGQFVRLGLNVGGEQVLRAYSVASAPQESILDFVIAKVEGGLLSPLLAELKPGDEVNITQPAGGFLRWMRYLMAMICGCSQQARALALLFQCCVLSNLGAGLNAS